LSSRLATWALHLPDIVGITNSTKTIAVESFIRVRIIAPFILYSFQ